LVSSRKIYDAISMLLKDYHGYVVRKSAYVMTIDFQVWP